MHQKFFKDNQYHSRMYKIFKLSFSLVICILMTSSAVYAYLDPGMGSMLIQILIGFMAGIIFSFKKVRRKITDIIFRKNTNEPKTDEQE